LLTATFDPNMVYTLSAQVGKLPGSAYYTAFWLGYAVQLAAGGTNVSGATYAGSVTGGTLIAQDVDSLLVPIDTFVTSTVTFRPNQPAAALAGQALQIRLCALENPADLTFTGTVVFDDVKLDGVSALFWDVNDTEPGAGGAAPSGTWSAASTNWNATYSGTGSTAAWTPGGVAYFAAGSDANGTYTVSVDGTQDISRVYFAGGTVTVMDGTALRLTSNATMDVAPGLNATVATPVSEDVAGRQLLKSSAGTLILSGNLAHTGATTIAPGGGTLVLSGDNSAATGGMNLNGGVARFESPASINGTTRNVAVNSGGTVVFGSSFLDADIPAALSERIVAGSAGTIAADNHAATNFDFDTPGLTGAFLGAVGNVTYTGTLTPNGAVYRLGGGGGTLTMADANAVTGSGYTLTVGGNASGGTVVLASSNDYDGGTTLNDGATLAVGNDGSLGSGALTFNGGVIQSADSSAHTLPNALAFSSVVMVAVTVEGTGDLTFSNTSATALGATRYFTINNPTSTFAQAFSGTGFGIVKAGPGTLILSGANTYTGATTIREGILRLGANDVLPDASAITVGGRMAGVIATLDANGNNDTIGALTLGCYTSTSGSAVTTGAGTLTLGGDVTYDSTNNPLGATISGKIAVEAPRVFTIGDSTTAANDLTVSAAISGAGGLTKAGAGTLVLSGNNSYTGVTAVSAGKLILSGDNAAATGGMSLNGGVTQFESPASINGTTRNVAVNAGGTVVFGSSFGDANIPAALSRITADSAGTIAANNYDATSFDFEAAGLTDAYLGAIGSVTYSGALTPNATGGYRLGGGGGTLTYGQVLTGSDQMLTVGGNVVLPNANSYDGGTILNAGTLAVGNNGALGDGPVLFNGGAIASADSSAHVLANPLLLNSNVTVGGTGNLTFSDTSETPLDDNRTFTITNPTTTFAQAFSGSGYSIIKAGGGTMVLSGASTYDGVTFISGGTLVLAGSNSSNGDTTVSAGTLQLASATNGGLAGGTLYFGSTTTTGSVIQAINADRTIDSNTVLNNTYGVVSGTQSLEIAGTFTNSLGNRTLTNNITTGKTLTLSGQVLLSEHATTGRTLIIAGTGDTTISGAIVNGATGAGGLTMSGTGTLALTSDAGAYTGVTTVSAGTLIVSKLADGGQPSSIGASAVAGTNLLLGNGVTLKYTGAGDSTDRQFRFNGNLAGLSITLDASGTGPINFTSATGPSHSTANQTRTLKLTGSNTGDNTLAANIGNNGTGLLSVVKDGDGTWVLSGANAYTGATTVNNGTLKVNGSLAAGSVVTVGGGTLGGTGVIAGPVTIEAGGALAPGASAGTLSTGPVTMAANSTYEWQIGSTTADKVVVTGALTLTSGWKLSLASDDGTKPTAGVEYDIFTYNGDFTLGSTILAEITQPVDWPIAIINQDATPGAGRIYLTFGQPGDTNNDGVVDAADFITLKKNFNKFTSGATKAEGDFNETGTVDWADLSTLMANFGAGGGAPATTPEPATLGLLAIGALALLRRRRA
jgi:fibronectin-binding autotransporter adhesin